MIDNTERNLSGGLLVIRLKSWTEGKKVSLEKRIKNGRKIKRKKYEKKTSNEKLRKRITIIENRVSWTRRYNESYPATLDARYIMRVIISATAWFDPANQFFQCALCILNYTPESGRFFRKIEPLLARLAVPSTYAHLSSSYA